MPATQGSRTLSTGPVPTNSSAIDHASICINSIGNRDGVKSTRARRCARENGFVGRRSPRPRTSTTFRPVHCDHSGEPGAVRACGRELQALQISGRVVSGERARQGDRFPCCARCPAAAIRFVLFPLANGGRSLASAVGGDRPVVRGHGSPARSLGSHVAVGPARQGRSTCSSLMGHAGRVRASIRFWSLVPIWRAAGRKGEEVSIYQLATCSGELMASPCSGMVIRATVHRRTGDEQMFNLILPLTLAESTTEPK